MAGLDVLVVGEALTDVIVSTDGTRSEVPGGSPLNVAVTLGRLGRTVGLLTAFGPDDRGRAIRAKLDEAGVRVHGDHHLPRTSTATATLAPGGSADYSFDLAWDPPSPILGPSAITHAGSIALFLEPGASRVEALLRSRRVAGLISLDPNIRSSIIGGRADIVRRFDALCELAHIVKLSDEDARWLYPQLTLERVVETILARGAALVALTYGGSGSELFTTSHAERILPKASEVVDTIGAGDSFMGALLSAVLDVDLARPLPAVALRQIGEFAALVSSRTVSVAGANPPWLRDLGLQLAGARRPSGQS